MNTQHGPSHVKLLNNAIFKVSKVNLLLLIIFLATRVRFHAHFHQGECTLNHCFIGAGDAIATVGWLQNVPKHSQIEVEFVS